MELNSSGGTPPVKTRLRRPGEVLQHHADRLERRQRRAHRLHAAGGRREPGLPLRRARRVHERLERAGLLHRRRVPVLGDHRRDLHQGGRDGRARRTTCRSRSRRAAPPSTVGAYNVCVSSIVPVTSADAPAAAATNSCTAVTGTGTITAQYGTGARHLQQQGLHRPEQRLGLDRRPDHHLRPGHQVQGHRAERDRRQRHTRRAYPSIFTGDLLGRQHRPAAGCRARSAPSPRARVQTSWTWAANGATGSYNAAYDVWFSTGAGGDPGAAAPERRLSDGLVPQAVGQPADRHASSPRRRSPARPGTSGTATTPATASRSSRTWRRRHHLDDVQPGRLHPGRGRARLPCRARWYLTNVFAGFEIWSGGVGLETTDFAVTVPSGRAGPLPQPPTHSAGRGAERQRREQTLFFFFPLMCR